METGRRLLCRSLLLRGPCSAWYRRMLQGSSGCPRSQLKAGKTLLLIPCAAATDCKDGSCGKIRKYKPL